MITTTKNGFRVDDITFKNARKQSAILEEMGENNIINEDEIKAPISITPEQVKDFYKQKISVSKDSNEKRVYSQTISWIDELLDVKKKLLVLESKQTKAISDDIGEIDDIVSESEVN